jgi:hypothetical protein
LAIGTPAGKSKVPKVPTTQQIPRAFEPALRQNINAWYQFVPIWPKDE